MGCGCRRSRWRKPASPHPALPQRGRVTFRMVCGMAKGAGDNPLAIESETMREIAHQVVDMLIARLEDPERDPVLRSATREETEQRLGEPPPEHGVAFDEILARLQTDILPLTARYDHPGYLAFVPGYVTGPAALGDFIAGACNLYGGSWKEGAGPSQVEITVLDWFKEWIGYTREAAGILTSGGAAGQIAAALSGAGKRDTRLGARKPDRGDGGRRRCLPVRPGACVAGARRTHPRVPAGPGSRAADG